VDRSPSPNRAGIESESFLERVFCKLTDRVADVLPDVWNIFLAQPTLVMIGDATDPLSHKPYHRDPRHVAKRAEAYLTSTGLADKAFFGAEAEFFIFNSIRFDQAPQHGFYFIDSNEGKWNSGPEGDGGDGPNLGYRTRYKEGYFPVPPSDHFQDLRTEMVLKMQEVGLDVECHHHEVATAGQAEI